MTLIHLSKFDNDYVSQWQDGQNSIFIDGTIKPFTYKSSEFNNFTDEDVKFIPAKWIVDELKYQIKKL